MSSRITYLPSFDAYLYEGKIYKAIEIQASATYKDYKDDGSLKIAQVIERIRLSTPQSKDEVLK